MVIGCGQRVLSNAVDKGCGHVRGHRVWSLAVAKGVVTCLVMCFHQFSIFTRFLLIFIYKVIVLFTLTGS